MIRWLAVFCINVYQRCISPYKGFHCAYGVLYQQDTCSGIIKNSIADSGLVSGLNEAQLQFQRCKTASKVLNSRTPFSQKGAIDCIDCSVFDACSFGGVDAPSSDCDMGSACSGACEILPFGLSRRFGLVQLAILTVIVSVLVGLGVTFYIQATSVHSIDVTAPTELFGSKFRSSKRLDHERDYVIHLSFQSTTTVSNPGTFGSDGVAHFTLPVSVRLNKIGTMKLIEKKLLRDEVVLEINSPVSVQDVDGIVVSFQTGGLW